MIPLVIILTCYLFRLDSNRDRDTGYSEVLKSAQTLNANVRMAPQNIPLPLPRKEASSPLSINHLSITSDIA